MAKILPSSTPFEKYRIYGPYLSKKENRNMVALVSKEHRTTMSYARYLLCVKENRWLTEEEEADHINDDKTDDRPDNVQPLSQPENSRKSNATGRTMVTLICPFCQEPFTRERRATHLVKGGNPSHCSRSCSMQHYWATR